MSSSSTTTTSVITTNNNNPFMIVIVSAVATILIVPTFLYFFQDETKTFLNSFYQQQGQQQRGTNSDTERIQDRQQRIIQQLEAENEELKQRLHLSQKEVDLYSGKEQEIESISDVKECDRIRLFLSQTIHKLEIRKEKLLLEEIESLKRSAKMTKENEESKECRICLDNRCEIALFPCGHVCLCDSCSKNDQVIQCPICRTQITRRLKVFL